MSARCTETSRTRTGDEADRMSAAAATEPRISAETSVPDTKKDSRSDEPEPKSEVYKDDATKEMAWNDETVIHAPTDIALAKAEDQTPAADTKKDSQSDEPDKPETLTVDRLGMLPIGMFPKVCLPLKYNDAKALRSTSTSIRTRTLWQSQWDPEAERAVLMAIRSRRPLRHWGTARPLGEWEGVTTDDAGRVRSLMLYSKQLQGAFV